MKELSIEEKAKRYDYALKVLHKYDDAIVMFSQSLREEMFPELKESEDDRIREGIIECLEQFQFGEEPYLIDDDIVRGYIDWLENQGEQKQNPCDDCTNHKGCINCENGELKETAHKPANKIEPKFSIDDWIFISISDGNKVFKIFDIIPERDGIFVYKLLETSGNYTYYYKEYVDKNARLWTIQDAKDGDILACGDKVTDTPFIFHNLNEELNPRSYCGVNSLGYFQHNYKDDGSWCDSDVVRPATIEQRGLLMRLMTDNGWVFNFEMKELERVGQKTSEETKENTYKTKSVWNKNDNIYFKDLFFYLKDNFGLAYDKDVMINWLISLKYKIKDSENIKTQKI